MLPPAQVARLKPSASAADVTANVQTQPASPTSAYDGSNGERQRGSASITVHANGTPGVHPSTESHGQHASEEPDGDLKRSMSSVTLDGEPRLFPGIVSSRSRRRSTKTSQADEGDVTRSRLKRYPTGETESVTERDTDDEE